MRRKKLLQLLQNCQSLSNENKKHFLQVFPSLSDEELERLGKILLYEESQRKKIDADYQYQTKMLDEEYKNIVQYFTKKEVPKLRVEAEKKHRVQEEVAADNMLNSL